MTEEDSKRFHTTYDILQYLENSRDDEDIIEIVHREGYLNNVHYDIQTGEVSNDENSLRLKVRFL